MSLRFNADVVLTFDEENYWKNGSIPFCVSKLVFDKLVDNVMLQMWFIFLYFQCYILVSAKMCTFAHR